MLDDMARNIIVGNGESVANYADVTQVFYSN